MHKIRQIGKLRSFADEELPRLQALIDQIIEGTNQNPFHQFEDVTVTTPPTPNTTFAVTLRALGQVPTGYVVIGVSYTPFALRDNNGNKLAVRDNNGNKPLDAEGNPVDVDIFPAAGVYTAPLDVATRWARNLLYLRCTVASATVMLRVT